MDRDQLHKRLIEVASKSPAKKRKVGAIVVALIPGVKLNYEILSEGYNYRASDGPCETDGITHEDVIHAEVDALEHYKAYKLPHDKYNGFTKVLFTTHPPCDGCKAALLAEGIKHEVMGDFLKFDSNKPRMALVPPSLGLEVGKVVTYGAKKYKANNWKKVKSQEPYINALERHLAAFKSGELVDPESGLSHMSHIACNAAFLLELNHLPQILEED